MKKFSFIDIMENKKEIIDFCKHKKIKYDDTIYTFDIEVTSLFEYENGIFKKFDYSKEPKYYQNKRKVALPYIAMFGINDDVYYTRDFFDFNNFLVGISDKNFRKIIYVHNLSYEFQFLRNIIEKYNYNIIDFLTYKKRKIISFVIDDLNIEFRCSYCLTNLSLELAAKKYNKKYNKKSGELDYNLERSPLTELSESELSYCEYDILSLYEIILYFKKQFKNIAKIPLTQTSIIRNELKNLCPWFLKEKITRMLPDNNMYNIFSELFTGGFVHSNYKNTNKIIKKVYSYDLTSAYPYCILAFKFPMTKFFEVKNHENFKYYYNKKWARIMLVSFDCKSKKGHSLISCNKILKFDYIKKDNGRVLEGNNIIMYLNEVDLYNINLIYNISNLKIYKLYCSRKKILPLFIIEKILSLYENKTKLKGVEGSEDFYMNEKQKLNSIYGSFVTSLIRESISYSNNNYINNGFNSIEELKERKFNNIFYYPWGIWVTSYCRFLLCSMISKIGEDVVYYDTDSIKFKKSKYLNLFKEENEIILNRVKENLKFYNIDVKKLSPTDINGVYHPIGCWDYEGKYDKFKTLGAKRYAFVKNKKITMVVSGLSKKCKIKNLKDFKIGKSFNYFETKKMISNYNDIQEGFYFFDKDNKKYECDNIKYSINLQPTTFEIGLSDDYIRLLDFINNFISKK